MAAPLPSDASIAEGGEGRKVVGDQPPTKGETSDLVAFLRSL
jgi:hypothetical protein